MKDGQATPAAPLLRMGSGLEFVGTALVRACGWTRVPPQVGNKSGQATKGTWGMSRRQEAMKGVEGCDKPGGTVKQVLIPGFPNDRMMNP